MADQKLSALTTIPAVDLTADLLYVVDISAGTSNKVTPSNLLGIAGSPLGTTDVQVVSNKTLGNTNTLTLKDTLFTLQDDGDTTKQAKFQLSGITTGTTRTYTVPNASGTLADLATAQIFTNKTLTSPVITGGTIDNTTITVDAIAGHTSATVGTVYGLGLSAGVITSSNAVVSASIASSAVTADKAATGFCVQQANTSSNAVATGTTIIPNDDTIPQNTEGDEYMTVTITPKSTTNILIIDILAFVSNSAAVGLVGAIFQDTTANALAAGDVRNTAPNEKNMLVVRHIMAAGTVSATTFKFRCGGDSAGTTTFNGTGGARRYGAITKSTMVITEYKA